MGVRKKGERRKVCLVVTNQVTYDDRIIKEARSLSKEYDVSVLGFLRDTDVEKERFESFTILRTPEPFLRRFFMRQQSLKSIIYAAAYSQTDDASKSSLLYNVKRLAFDFILYIFFLNKALSIYRKLKHIKADIYHANDLDTLMPCYWAAKKNGAKLIYDSHELFVEEGTFKTGFFKRRVFNFERRYIKRADSIITVNKSIAEELKKRYALKKEPDIILNLPVYEHHTRRPTDFSRVKIFFHGFMTAERGLRETILALKLIKDPHVELHLRGSGTNVDELKKMIEKSGLQRRVFFHDPILPKGLIAESTKGDMGIIPYKPTCLNNIYSTPNKLFQYMMAGLALAVSDLPELRRFVKDARVGDVFDPSDPKSIARCVDRMLADKKRFEDYRNNSLTAAKEFNWGRQEVKFLKLYSKLYD